MPCSSVRPKPSSSARTHLRIVCRARDELRVGLAHRLDDDVDVARQEAGLDADPVALLDRAAHDAAQDVAAVLVGGHDAVGDQEGHRARVVGEDPQRALVGVARARARGRGAMSGANWSVSKIVSARPAGSAPSG